MLTYYVFYAGKFLHTIKRPDRWASVPRDARPDGSYIYVVGSFQTGAWYHATLYAPIPIEQVPKEY